MADGRFTVAAQLSFLLSKPAVSFTARDPFGGFSEQPYSLHPYQYGYSDPVLFGDPSGQVVPMCAIGYRPVIQNGQFAGCEDDPNFPEWLWFLKGSIGPLPIGGVVAGGALPQVGGQAASEAAKQALGKTLEVCGTLLAYLLGQQALSGAQANVQTRTDNPVKKYALDTNALIALEHWVILSIDDRDGSRLDAKIKGTKAYYATVAREEFLKGGTQGNFNILVARYGLTEIPSVPQSVIDSVTAKYAGRKLTPHTLNDIQIVAAAMVVGATLLTREHNILSLFPPPISESW